MVFGEEFENVDPHWSQLQDLVPVINRLMNSKIKAEDLEASPKRFLNVFYLLKVGIIQM